MFPPSALTTLALIKDMITRPNKDLPGGIPSIIIPDNGVEFKNNSLARVCEQLKITITPSQIGTPNNKPHIERFFGTLTEGILQNFLVQLSLILRHEGNMTHLAKPALL
jgi:transposase InsO family protein